jgi:hypothetical protein
MGITQHGGKRPGRKRKCGGSAAPPWKPYLCLPKRELRARTGRPRAIHMLSKKERPG